ncbi:MAG TPA: FHA domain-containing protein [Vicinamibacteria bacterium]|nr:FHA domain-containing protein [Vicinamibacteria bacterium]
MADSGARLTVLNGPLSGKELALEEVVDNVLIGSDSACRFHLPAPGISPIHARIWMDAGGVTVYDTHSPRGLYINDDRVNGQAPLKNGDVLWLGTPGEEEAIMIQVRLPTRGSEAAPSPPRAGDEEPEIVEETVVMSSPPVAAPQPEPEPVVEPTQALESIPAAEDFAVAAPDDAEATMLEMPAEDVGPSAAEDENDATVVDFTPPASASPITGSREPNAFAVAEPDDTEATRIVSVEPTAAERQEPEEYGTIAMTREAAEEPVHFALDRPPASPQPPAFEDETSEPPAPEPPPEPVRVAAPPPPPPRPVVTPPPPTPPRPAPRPPRAAAPPPTPRPAPARPAPPTGSRNLAIGLGALVFAAAGLAAWWLLKGASPEQAATLTTPAPAPPSTAAGAGPPPTQAVATEPVPEPIPEPPVEEAVTIVKNAPPTTLPAIGASPRPAPSARAATAAPPPTTLSAEAVKAQQSAQQVASLLGRAESAAAARDHAGAAAAYEEVLKLEPGNTRATEGRAQAQAALASLKKSFVAGRTTVTGGKAAKGGLSGFDSEDVSVAKALDYSGRIDFEASPRSVKPGDTFAVQVYLTNDGKKAFKIGSVTATTAVNSARSGGPVAVRDSDVEPGQRVLLTDVPGTWQASTTSWSLEIVVISSRNDRFRNTLTWR